MKLEDLIPGDTVLRDVEGSGPMLYERRVDTVLVVPSMTSKHVGSTYVFRCLQTWNVVLVHATFSNDVQRSERWDVLERSSQVGHSGSVKTDGEDENLDHGEEAMIDQNLTSATPETTTPAAETPAEAKAKKTRTVDYTRTDKRPHSFRYKRHSTFVARNGAVTLSKDADGAFVIGPGPEGMTADAGQLTAGQLELVSVKKRPNGKTAIAFSHPELGTVVAYDARAARAALRAG